jgi:ATP-dependent protease ClpP protease subunit
MERDRFFTPEEACGYRLIDRVLESREAQRTPTGFGREAAATSA